ncbi:MAG: AAA family ATPase [Microgenomates group bacterium]
MEKNFLQFSKKSINNFLEAIFNLFIFLPYFFSVSTLLKTLFYPWKNLIAKKTKPGFSIDEWLNRFSFNTISRGIGFFMRLSLLSFYVLIQIIFIILLPFAGLIYLLLLPLVYIKTFFQTSETEKKEKIKSWFLASHLLKEENRNIVENWFEKYYALTYQKRCWWKLSNLLTFPPLARDWAVGYTPILDQYTQELTTPSYQSKIKNIVNREKEIDQIERILTKSEEANVIIVGEEGIGKHTIVDAFSKKIYEGKTNNLLAYKRVLKLNMEKILSATEDRTKREEFLEELFTEAQQAKNIIIFIDKFEKYRDYFFIIEKFAKKSTIQFIAITTPFSYQQIIFPQEKITQLFSKNDVYEVTKEEAETILFNTAFDFEKRYQLVIPYETIKTLIEKSDYYITYIPFPEKAIQLLDEACALTKEFYLASDSKRGKILPTVTPEIIDKVLTEKTHIPTTITSQMKEKLLQLENLLKEKVLYQDQAIDEVSSTLRRSFVLVGKRKKPLASFLFLGPTGVGKTETAKAIAEVFFKSSTDSPYLLRFDMSLYQSKDDISKLIGSIDTGNPGLLTTAIRQQPYGVLLLDELEKADDDLLNIFLTILDEGYFTDGYGKRVDCKNLVIIATSNAGSDFLYQQQIHSPNSTNFHQIFINYLIEKKLFSPEFLNRFDGIVIFRSLTSEAILEIAKKIVAKIARDIYQLHKITLNVSDESLKDLAQKGYHPQFGARDMERLIRQEIEDKVAKMILAGKIREGETINL